MKLTHQLVAGFGLITIFVIMSGITGIIATDAINSKVETLTRITTPTVQTVDDMIITLAQMNRVVQEFAAEDSENNLENLRSEFDLLDQRMNANQREVLKLIDEENLLANLQAAERKYSGVKEKAIKVMDAHRSELAEKADERQRYKNVKEALAKQLNEEAKELSLVFNEIATRVNTLNKKADEESRAALHTTRTILIIITFLSLSSALAIAIVLGRVILKPVNELAQAAAKVSTGDFDIAVKETKSNNELRHLTNTFNKMIASLKGMMEESPRLKQFMDISPSAEKTSPHPEKFPLAASVSYILKETPTKRAYEIFVDKVTHDYQGLCIARTNPDLIKKQYNLQKTPLLWLSDVKDTKTFSSSDLLLIGKLILDFIAKAEKSVILLDRLDYLIAKHGFQEVLKLIIKINDRVMISNAIFLIPLDPSLLKAEEYTFLEKELQFLPETGEATALPPDLIKIIQLIANRKSLGRSVTFKDISRELMITAPTTQRRIIDLYNRNLITIVKQGRNKILQLTPEGEHLAKVR